MKEMLYPMQLLWYSDSLHHSNLTTTKMNIWILLRKSIKEPTHAEWDLPPFFYKKGFTIFRASTDSWERGRSVIKRRLNLLLTIYLMSRRKAKLTNYRIVLWHSLLLHIYETSVGHCQTSPNLVKVVPLIWDIVYL